jgi:hypothetical protein
LTVACDRFEDIQQAIDREWMFQALREMILIRSENPFDDPPAEGYREKEMADYLAGHLSALGLDVEYREVRPGRPNVFGRLKGKQGRSTLMLAGQGIFGKDPGVEAFVAGSDAPHMGFPTVICGPGGIA